MTRYIKRIVALLMAIMTILAVSFPACASTSSEVYRWSLQTATALHKTNSNFDFLLGDYNRDGAQDVYGISRIGQSNTTEIHVLNGGNRFASFLLHTGTALHTTPSELWQFALGDYNRDGIQDVYAINTMGNSGMLEIHILNGANAFQSFLLHTATPIGGFTDYANYDFDVADYNNDGYQDLFMIKRNGASRTTEVHILNGANGYQSFLLQTATALGITNNNFEFAVGYDDADRSPDLFIFSKNGASASTEVHILSGSSNYQAWRMHTASPLHPTDANYEFCVDKTAKSDASVYVIKKQGAASTEVHVMSKAGGTNSAAQRAIQWAVGIANDASHGYDQAYRWGPNYDCSSLVIQAYQNAGVPVKSNGATYTGNMRSVFLRCGFSDVTGSVNRNNGAGLVAGDVLLNPSNHTAMYIGNGQIVQASINEYGGVTGGKSGDQTGREIWVRGYYNYPWTYVLRYSR